MQITNDPHPSLALSVRRTTEPTGKPRAWEIACPLGGGLAYGRTRKEALAALERARGLGADRLTADVLLARGVLCTSRAPGAFAPSVLWSSWSAAPYSATEAGCRDALFTCKPYDLPRIRGLGLGSAKMSEALRGGFAGPRVSSDAHFAEIARVREDFRAGRFTAEEAAELELVGERVTWYQLDEYLLDALAREAPTRALVEICPSTRGPDLPTVTGEISSPV